LTPVEIEKVDSLNLVLKSNDFESLEVDIVATFRFYGVPEKELGNAVPHELPPYPL